MPSDYGDEAGEKLFDWMLRVGQDAGAEAMLASAERLKSALRNARGSIGTDGGEPTESPEWAKLNMKEFAGLPEYDSLKQVMDRDLTGKGIVHQFVVEKDQEYLLFKVKDAPAISEAFKELEEKVDSGFEKALSVFGKTREQLRDSIELDKRATSAREASKAIEAQRGNNIQINRMEVKSK